MNVPTFERSSHVAQLPKMRPATFLSLRIRWLMWQSFARTSFFTGGLALALLTSNSQRACAQVVQLPSQHVFSSNGSVLVPDGGSALLGGSGYARQGSTSSGFGPLSNRAFAGSTGGSTLSASVQIIDLEALDRAILAGAAPRTNAAIQTTPATTPDAGDSTVRQRTRLSSRYPDSTRQLSANNTERVGADPGKWQRVLSGGGTPTAVNASMVEANVRYYVELGDRAERSGSVQAARVYYRLAREAMTPDLVAQYENALRARAAEAAASSSAEQGQASRNF